MICIVSKHCFVAHSFIHSGYSCSTSSSPLLLRVAPNTALILCRSFTPKRHRQLRVKESPKIVSEQITSYLSTNDLLSKYQLGFRRDHSTETLLLRLLSDCYGAIDRGRVTLFDTVDHQLLINRLSVSYGLSGLPLDWITS